MCDCFKIGGPFIAEDPDCPIHGTEARRQEEQEENRWEAKFVPDTNLLNLVTQIITAKTLGQESEVRRLMAEATSVHMNRADEDDFDFAEKQIRDIVLFFAK